MEHRHEKRLGVLKQDLSALSCAWAKVCGPMKPDHLSYEMERRYCIKCNRQHWFFTSSIEYVQPVFDPNQYWYSELVQMGFFAQFEDTETG